VAVAFLEGSVAVTGSIELVELLECTLSPDDESPNVTTRCEIFDVEAVDVSALSSRDVTDGTGKTVILVVDDEDTLALDIATVAHFPGTCADFARVGRAAHISGCLELAEELDGILGLLDLFSFVRNDKRNLRNVVDLVTTSHNERWDS